MKIKKYFSTPKGIEINYYRVIHGIKTAIACLLGFTLETYYDWPFGHWIPITSMVVMSAQTHFGGAVHKAFMRFLGTMCGVTTAAVALWLFNNDIFVTASVIFISIMIFAYIASSHRDISYAGTLGGVTVILILAGQNVGLETAIQRGSAITLGIVIALLVSRFIFPIHARDRFRYHVATTLRNLNKLYSSMTLLPTGLKYQEGEIAAKLNSNIAADIAAQPRLIHEAIVGSREFAAKKVFFNAIINSEQNLNRLINLICLSLYEAKSLADAEKQLQETIELNKVIRHSLNNLADSFELNEKPRKLMDLNKALIKINKIITKLPQNENSHEIIAEHSFLFFMEQLLKELENLQRLIIKVNSKKANSML